MSVARGSSRLVAMESSSVASASSEAGSTRSQEIEELERFIDSYVLEYQVQGLLGEKNDIDPSADKTQSHISQARTTTGPTTDHWKRPIHTNPWGSMSSSLALSRMNGSTVVMAVQVLDPVQVLDQAAKAITTYSVHHPRMGTETVPLTSWAQTSGLPTRWTPMVLMFSLRASGLALQFSYVHWLSGLPSTRPPFGATWDLQPEKLDFSQFPRKQFRGTPKPLPHIDREGMMKSKFEDDGVDLNDMGRFLPNLPIFPPLPNEAEIATTKKLFRRRRSDRRSDIGPCSSPLVSFRLLLSVSLQLGPAGPPQDQLTVLLPAQGRRQVSRRQQRPPGGGGGGGKPHTPPHHHQQQPHSQQQQQPQMTNQTQQFSADHQSDGTNAKYGGRGHHGGQPSRGPPHHCYSQNRRWYQLQKQQTNSVCQAPGPGDRGPPRTSKEAEGGRSGEQEPATDRPKEAARGDDARKVGKEGGRVNLLQSSKERLRRRLKEKYNETVSGIQFTCSWALCVCVKRERCKVKSSTLRPWQEEVPMVMVGPQRNRMEKLLELLNSMRSNSSGAEDQLSSFMEEAQNSADSEETLAEIVQTIYRKAVSDRGFAATAAKLCDKMALFMVEGTKFRSLLLNMLQVRHHRVDLGMGLSLLTRPTRPSLGPCFVGSVGEGETRGADVIARDFTRRVELQRTDVECWLGFITFLCEVFGTMRSSMGEPFRVLVGPIYTCLRELLESVEVKEDAVLCCSMELQSAGRLLEEQFPEMMSELLAVVRDKMLCPSESPLTRSLLMEVVELHAHRWGPLEALTTQYYNRTIQKLTA
ncbi:hypothetical protein P4O66_016895 [Electrophorus voltai]|uniref:MIF4G domain-containing protein n=1 Tax=Electrophorus voltai TaxID=2609070 RepID=A0AAD8YWS0_9TELE|nr:hypothetical protein P4O66_016895 [Electrophorus voltai]